MKVKSLSHVRLFATPWTVAYQAPPSIEAIFQFIMIYPVKGFGIVNKAEIDVFLEFSCFFDDPTVVGNLTSGSSAFFLNPT